MRQHAKCREDRSNRCGDIADFRFFKMAAAAILDFGKFKFLTVGTLKSVELRLRAKFWRNRSKRVRHLGLVLRVLGPPTKSTWWSL